MGKRKTNVSVWITHLAKIMSGDLKCQYQYWYRTNYFFDSLPSDFNTLEWQANHTKLLDQMNDQLTEDGHSTRTEAELRKELFEIVPNVPKGIDIVGKMDIISKKGLELVVHDSKTGKAKGSDILQVQIYMYLLSKNPKLAAYTIKGHVQYLNGKEENIGRLPDEFEENFNHFVKKMVDSVNPMQRVPGWDCKYCPISNLDCELRQDEDVDALEDFF